MLLTWNTFYCKINFKIKPKMIVFYLILIGFTCEVISSDPRRLDVTRSGDVRPGVTLRLTQKGLNYAGNVAMDLLSSEIHGKAIPDQHGSDHVVVGKVYYDVTGMHITHFTKPGFTVTESKGRGLDVSLTNAGLSLHGDWRYKYKVLFVIRDHGSFDLDVSGASVKASITMGRSADGHPTISMKSCSSSIGHVHIKLHGGASWLYNLFRGNIEHAISGHVKDVLCSSVRKAIDTDANKALARMKVKIPIPKTPFTIDYRLTSSPVFGSGFIESHHKGEFFWTSDQSEAPFTPTAIKQPSSASKMVTICLSDYVTDTLGYVLNKHGFLKYTLTRKDLKNVDNGFLNTTCSGGLKCIGAIVPQLGQKFPNSSVEIYMATTSAPTIHCASGDVSGKFNGTVIFNVRLPDGKVTLGFATHTVANVSLTGQISVNDSNRITAKVQHIKFHMAVTKSNVGPIADSFLNTIFNIAIKGFIIPQMNKIGAKGFRLPAVDVVQFVDPHIYILEKTLCVGTDAKYAPHNFGM